MQIRRIYEHLDAWKTFREERKEELNEIFNVLSKASTDRSKQTFSEFVANSLRKLGWSNVKHLNSRLAYGRSFGKNGVFVITQMTSVAELRNWIVVKQQPSVRAPRNVPLQILLTSQRDDPGLLVSRLLDFDTVMMGLDALPFELTFGYLVFECSSSKEVVDPTVLSYRQKRVAISRSLEFPPHLYQAGLGILSFFGTYLREKYPDEPAKIKIEQEENLVRLIVESNGKLDVIERALEEYQLIVTGKKKPEDMTDNQLLVLKLQNKLDLAMAEVRANERIMRVQSGQIDRLMEMVGIALVNKNSVSIDFKPNLVLSNTNIFENNVSVIQNDLQQIKRYFPAASSEHKALEELEAGLNEVGQVKVPEAVKSSPALVKLKRFIDSVEKGNTKLGQAIKTAEGAWDAFRSLAGKYNAIAEWCGAPQVPKVFTK